jgi:hypothetical protein
MFRREDPMATWDLLFQTVIPKRVKYTRSIISYLDIMGFQNLENGRGNIAASPNSPWNLERAMGIEPTSEAWDAHPREWELPPALAPIVLRKLLLGRRARIGSLLV